MLYKTVCVYRQLAGQIRVINFSSLIMERQAAIGFLMTNALESPHEIQVPSSAAEFAVRNDMIAGGLLLCYKLGDALVLYRF